MMPTRSPERIAMRRIEVQGRLVFLGRALALRWLPFTSSI